MHRRWIPSRRKVTIIKIVVVVVVVVVIVVVVVVVVVDDDDNDNDNDEKMMMWVDTSPCGMPDAQGRGQREDFHSRCDSHFGNLAMKQRQRLAECASPGADPKMKMLQLQRVSLVSWVRPIEDAGCGVAEGGG